eukprot:COSAG02_NODE_44404_length_366_cov_1.164794_1_plen_64_part_10
MKRVDEASNDVRSLETEARRRKIKQSQIEDTGHTKYERRNGIIKLIMDEMNKSWRDQKCLEHVG